MKNGFFKNIIFDLGNVLININPENTARGFMQHFGEKFIEVYTNLKAEGIMHQFECGLISPEDFRQSIRNYSGTQISDETIDEIWNATLLDFPQERIDLLLKLRTKYRIFLLSNTNDIHANCFQKEFQKIKEQYKIESIFEKEYYSHTLHVCKPEPEIYQKVIEDAGIDANETIFIDDLPANINGASLSGLKAHHLPAGKDVCQLVKDILDI